MHILMKAGWKAKQVHVRTQIYTTTMYVVFATRRRDNTRWNQLQKKTANARPDATSQEPSARSPTCSQPSGTQRNTDIAGQQSGKQRNTDIAYNRPKTCGSAVP